MRETSLKKILLTGLLLILVTGCHQTQIKPTKPTLQVQSQTDGGICLDRQNTLKLGNYILELEKGYAR